MQGNNIFTEEEVPTDLSFFTESRTAKKNLPDKGGQMWPSFIHWSDVKRTKAKPTVENLKALLDFIKVGVEYNIINKRIRMTPLGDSSEIAHAFKGAITEDSAVAYILSKAEEYDMKTKFLESYLEYIATENPVNPVITWIRSKPWDGVSRLQELCNSVSVEENTGYRDELIRMWLTQAIAAITNKDGISARGVLVFQGRQHRGKTQWFTSLFPEPISAYAKEGMSIDPNSRDSVMACLRYWAVELGELNGVFKKSDMESLKRFIGARSDVWRLSYAKMDREMVRTTVFYASVNDPIFLRDNENTRFWTVPILSCNEKHGVDMQQLWAEMLYRYEREGESYNLTPKMLEHVNAENKRFTVTASIEEKILTSLDWEGSVTSRQYKTITEIVESIGVKFPTHADLITAGRVFSEMGCPTRRVRGVKQVACPPKKTDWFSET